MPSINDLNNIPKQQLLKMIEVQGIVLIQRGEWKEYFKMLTACCDNNIEL